MSISSQIGEAALTRFREGIKTTLLIRSMELDTIDVLAPLCDAAIQVAVELGLGSKREYHGTAAASDWLATVLAAIRHTAGTYAVQVAVVTRPENDDGPSATMKKRRRRKKKS